MEVGKRQYDYYERSDYDQGCTVLTIPELSFGE